MKSIIAKSILKKSVLIIFYGSKFCEKKCKKF